jgi:hypothetical protein
MGCGWRLAVISLRSRPLLKQLSTSTALSPFRLRGNIWRQILKSPALLVSSCLLSSCAPRRPSKLLGILRPPEIRMHRLRRLWPCWLARPSLPSWHAVHCCNPHIQWLQTPPNWFEVSGSRTAGLVQRRGGLYSSTDGRLVDSSSALKPDYLHTNFAVLVQSDGLRICPSAQYCPIAEKTLWVDTGEPSAAELR